MWQQLGLMATKLAQFVISGLHARLRHALHNNGAQSETVVASLLKRVKSLAVKRRNNLVNIMTIQKMGQQREEGVLSFLSRLNGQADLCDLARTTVVSGLCDTGAQMCVTGTDVGQRMGLRKRDMVPVALRFSVADNVEVQMVGAAFMSITGRGGVKNNQMVYIASKLEDFYISKEACMSLGIIPYAFPAVQQQEGPRRRRSSSAPPPPTSLAGLGTQGEPSMLTGEGSVTVGPCATLMSLGMMLTLF